MIESTLATKHGETVNSNRFSNENSEYYYNLNNMDKKLRFVYINQQYLVSKYGNYLLGKKNNLIPFYILGDMEYEGNNYRNALIYYEKAVSQNSYDLNTVERMAISYLYTEDYEKALEMSQKLITQAPSDFRGYWLKGLSLVYLHKLEEAIASFNKAFKYTGRETKAQATVLTSRSNAFLITGKWEKALSDIEKVLQIQPKAYVVIINKGIALKKLGKKKESERIIQEILPHIENKYTRACAFATLGDKKNMLKELEVAIKEDIGNKVSAKLDPDFAEYQDDPDFRKIISQ